MAKTSKTKIVWDKQYVEFYDCEVLVHEGDGEQHFLFFDEDGMDGNPTWYLEVAFEDDGERLAAFHLEKDHEKTAIEWASAIVVTL